MLFSSIAGISNSIRSRYLDRYALAAVVSIVCFFFIATTEIQAQQLTSGTSGRQFRQQGIAAVPLELLTQETQAKLQPVLDKPSIYRRLPKMSIECDADYFRFLVRHPEVVVEIWKLMGVTKMDTARTGPFNLESNDGAGTISDLELVYGDGEKHIFFGTGTYEGPLLRKKLTGRCVLVMQTQHATDDKGKPTAICQLDVYLKVDNVAAGVIARSLQSLVGPTADHNFVESLKFVERLHGTTVRNGPGVQLMGERLDLQPNVLTGFQQVAGLAFQRGNEKPAEPTTKLETRVSSSGASAPQRRSFRSR